MAKKKNSGKRRRSWGKFLDRHGFNLLQAAHWAFWIIVWFVSDENGPGAS